MTLREKAEHVGTFRAIRVYLMETLARWTPTSPELEAKVLFGRHIWDTAQHADALGKRTLELRAPLHYTLRPTAAYMNVLEEVAAQTGTAERIRCFHEVIVPGLKRRHAQYMAASDRLQDEPTARILDRIDSDDARMIEESRAALGEMSHLKVADPELIERLRNAEKAVRDFVALGSGATLSRGAA